MAQKRFTASAEQLEPDGKYGSKLIAKFINVMMWDGKKTIAEGIIYDAMEIIEKRVTDVPPDEVFETAIQNVKPMIEVRSKRVGGANYQVPTPVSSKRQLSLGMRWIRDAVRKGGGRPMHRRLADEIVAAYRKEGAAYQTRENVHRMAEANKAFAHFAF